MTTTLKPTFYPSGDGQPVAETFVHLYALLTTLEVLKQFFDGQRATVLANQYLYYSQDRPRLRVAPDVMVISGVEPGPRDNYKIWEEGQTPAVIFEMTSAGTRVEDKSFKKTLYAQLEVQEYWLFDPKGEWIAGQLQGYRLITVEEAGEWVGHYVPITDGISAVLGLRLQVEGAVLGFYRLDNGQKLLIPSELAAELRLTADRLEQEQLRAERAEELLEQVEHRVEQAEHRAEQAEHRAEQAEHRAEQERLEKEQLAERLRALGIDPDNP